MPLSVKLSKWQARNPQAASKVCAKCGATFARRGPAQKFCDSCLTHKCAKCGVEFTAHVASVFCSSKCRDDRQWTSTQAGCHPDRPHWAHGKCKQCYMDGYMPAWRSANKERLNKKQREHGMTKLYGLTREQYEALLADQDGKCAICRAPFLSRSRYRGTRIDHVPGSKPKKVRGLLCHGCNLFVGYLEKRHHLIGAAFAYIWPGEK